MHKLHCNTTINNLLHSLYSLLAVGVAKSCLLQSEIKQSLLTTEVIQIRVFRHPMSTIETDNWWLHHMDFETLIIVCYAAEL